MYTDKFIRAAGTIDGIRMASLDDIAAMKINAISRGGRKKDFVMSTNCWRDTLSAICWNCIN